MAEPEVAAAANIAYIWRMSNQRESMATNDQPGLGALGNRVLILNGFSDREIMEIMRQVKAMCRDGGNGEALIDAERRDLIFAKATPHSLESKLGDLILELSGDHEYLRKNPPRQRGTPA